MSTITISGRTFELNGNRWSPKGLCYQPTDNVDPISNDNLDTIKALLETGGNWAELNINAIRVYQVNPSASHGKVMDLLKKHGIYVMVGCVNSSAALPRNGNYPCDVLARVKKVVDTFQQYDNVMAFSVSNELLFSTNQPNVAAAAKALIRDTKAYIKAQSYRQIPVGLALRDDMSPTGANTLAGAHFYACGDKKDRADYIAYNQYRWCDYTSPVPQGSIDSWSKLYNDFKAFPVPVFLGEYGCNSGSNRDWRQVPYLFGSKQLTPSSGSAETMSNVFSGGFAFRYIEHGQNLGLVDTAGNPISGNGFSDLGTEYGGITSFAASTVAGTDPLPCQSDYNPPVPAQCGTTTPTGPTISITVTNEISPATTVSWSYSDVTTPGDNDWHVLLEMQAGASPTSLNLPTSAKWLSLAYKSSDGKWYGGCKSSTSDIKEGNTVHGIWNNNGQGACKIG